MYDESDALGIYAEEVEQASEDDLWFLPGPMDDEPDYLPPGPRAEPRETEVLDEWRKAEGGQAARLARVAGRVGALDDRLKRGPEGWRHRLALMEAADLSWHTGDRISQDRLALWISLRLSGVQDDTAALARVGWAIRRLTGGPGPEQDLSAFLDRRDPENISDETEPFVDRASGWLDLMGQATDLHPITRACAGFHLWRLAGLGQHDDRLERWLYGMEAACLTAVRHLDDIEAWSARAEAEMTLLSGRTPPALRAVLTEWPLVSAPMAQALTSASRAAVQRNLAWMQERGLIREVTGQGRFRMWKATN